MPPADGRGHPYVKRENRMAVFLDGDGKRLAVHDRITAGPNRYGIPAGTKGRIVRYSEKTGRIQVEFYTERGTEKRVMYPFTVRKA